MSCEISVIIPLYNKEREIESAVRSVLRQTLQPCEIIVVNDGSTDKSAEIVSRIDSPLIKLVHQPNSGVSAARNRGVKEAKGDYLALLDGDDYWEAEFLEKSVNQISFHPDCSIYATGFNIVRNGKKHMADSPVTSGILPDFFCEAMRHYVCTASSVVIPKVFFTRAGGFPEGMKIGEDQWLWIALASLGPVCFTPEALSNYVITASNRSAKTYSPEKTVHSFEEFYRPEEGDSCRNEFIARCALNKAITLSSKGDVENALRAEKFFSYTSTQKRALRKLRILNRTPLLIRPLVHSTYNYLAWAIARKGL